ncbi:MAG TPA: AAA family ATPase [Candidatus Elarobacter sp.]|nr:AAA family ATPase [Candidatus Elarobacter sp.]
MDRCFPKVTLGLFGPTGVGKSTVARVLGDRFSLPVRHCSQALRERAASLGLELSDVPKAVHDEIDEETRCVARSVIGGLVIEGRFLDKVLYGIDNIILVRLTCLQEMRRSRILERTGVQSLEAEDRRDEELRGMLYSYQRQDYAPTIVIDTSAISPEEVATEIAARAIDRVR